MIRLGMICIIGYTFDTLRDKTEHTGGQIIRTYAANYQ